MSYPFTGTALGSGGGGGGTGGTPDPHAASHENGGGDELALDGSQITTGITGTGDVVKANTPTLLTPILGTPISGALTNCTAPASIITSGTLVHERGGLEADVSAYSGLVKISGGATSQATAGTDYVSPALAGSVSHVFPYSASEPYFYFGTSQAPNLNHASTLVANRLYVVQFTCPNNVSVLRDLSAYVVTGVGGTSIRWGIYTANATTFLPDSLVANTDSGDQSSATSSTLRTFTPGSTVTLTKGQLYFIALHSDGAPSLRASNTTGYTIAGSDLSSTGWFSAFYVSQTYGAMPSTFPAGARTYVSGGAASAFAAMVGARFTS